MDVVFEVALGVVPDERCRDRVRLVMSPEVATEVLTELAQEVNDWVAIKDLPDLDPGTGPNLSICLRGTEVSRGVSRPTAPAEGFDAPGDGFEGPGDWQPA
jgi:hypothetical protein